MQQCVDAGGGRNTISTSGDRPLDRFRDCADGVGMNVGPDNSGHAKTTFSAGIEAEKDRIVGHRHLQDRSALCHRARCRTILSIHTQQ